MGFQLNLIITDQQKKITIHNYYFNPPRPSIFRQHNQSAVSIVGWWNRFSIPRTQPSKEPKKPCYLSWHRQCVSELSAWPACALPARLADPTNMVYTPTKCYLNVFHAGFSGYYHRFLVTMIPIKKPILLENVIINYKIIQEKFNTAL